MNKRYNQPDNHIHNNLQHYFIHTYYLDLYNIHHCKLLSMYHFNLQLFGCKLHNNFISLHKLNNPLAFYNKELYLFHTYNCYYIKLNIHQYHYSKSTLPHKHHSFLQDFISLHIYYNFQLLCKTKQMFHKLKYYFMIQDITKDIKYHHRLRLCCQSIIHILRTQAYISNNQLQVNILRCQIHNKLLQNYQDQKDNSYYSKILSKEHNLTNILNSYITTIQYQMQNSHMSLLHNMINFMTNKELDLHKLKMRHNHPLHQGLVHNLVHTFCIDN